MFLCDESSEKQQGSTNKLAGWNVNNRWWMNKARRKSLPYPQTGEKQERRASRLEQRVDQTNCEPQELAKRWRITRLKESWREKRIVQSNSTVHQLVRKFRHLTKEVWMKLLGVDETPVPSLQESNFNRVERSTWSYQCTNVRDFGTKVEFLKLLGLVTCCSL